MQRMPIAGLVTLAVVAAVSADPKLARTEAIARAEAVANVDYTLDVGLAAQQDTYVATAAIEFDLVGSPAGLFLDFRGKSITRAEVNSRPERLAIEEGRVALPALRLAKGRNRLVIEYRNDFDHDGSGFHRIVDPGDGNEYVYTDFEPFDANRLFPCFDQPDLKASYLVSVSAPPSWEVVANGRELSALETPAGRLHRFERTARFSTYIMAICAGPFAVWNDARARIPSRLLTTQSMARYMDAAELQEITRQGLDFYDWYFGIPYPFRKYDQVFLPQFNAGAMENVACVTFNDRFLYRYSPTNRERERRASVVLHEMAHMWFGDMVTMKWWDDVWLNESFATYMSTVALTKATRFKGAWETFSREKAGAYVTDELPTTHPIVADVKDTETAFSNFDGITYGKGASALQQLAFFVGEAAFRSGVTDYLKAHVWGNARLADFIGAIARAAHRELGGWSKAWLESKGVNTVTPRLVLKAGKVAEFWLDQTPGNGTAVLRPHRLRIAAYPAGEGPAGLGTPTTVDVAIDGAATRVRALEGRPAPRFVQVNAEDFAYAKVFLDPASLEYAIAHVDRLPSTWLRTSAWKTLWFMVRDGALAPSRYLELVESKLALEPDDRVVQAALSPTHDLVARFMTSEARAPWQARLVELAWARLAAGPPGSDLQKAWWEPLLANITRAAQGERLAGLLAGTLVVPGLDIDQERRWGLLADLAFLGHPSALQWTAAEEKRDPTERGTKNAFRVRTIPLDPEVKQAAWKRFLEDRSTSLDFLRNGMSGFFSGSEEHPALEPWARKYFEALPQVVKDRDLSFAMAFAGILFPAMYVEPWVGDAIEKVLRQGPDLPFPIRRGLLERADELARALRIRSKFPKG